MSKREYDEGNPSDAEQPWCNECGSLVVAGHCNCDQRTPDEVEDDERTLVRDAELLGERYEIAQPTAPTRPDEAAIAALLARRWPAVPFTITISTIDLPGDPTDGEIWLEITWPPAGLSTFEVSAHLQHLVGDHEPGLFDCVKCHSKRTQEASR
jgi:hypothetical protein